MESLEDRNRMIGLTEGQGASDVKGKGMAVDEPEKADPKPEIEDEEMEDVDDEGEDMEKAEEEEEDAERFRLNIRIPLGHAWSYASLYSLLIDLRCFTLMVNKNDSLGDVKQMIENKKGFPVETQRLETPSRVRLEDNNKMLSDYGITSESTLCLLLTPRTGPPTPPVGGPLIGNGPFEILIKPFVGSVCDYSCC